MHNKMDNNSDFSELQWTLHPEQHQRIIIHIDIDCFYAQVEMVRNPELRDKPVGVKQKYLMVTSNYIARALGVKKQMYVKEAMKALPELILIDGSDLTPYRQCSNEISSVAQVFTPHIERMGLDEVFLDITDKVNECSKSFNSEMVGHLYGDKERSQMPLSDPCGCGCYKRLIVGTYIASELRREILEKTGVTCCAGVAHNKVLAKMISGYYKPNQQTVLFPWQVCELMSSLDHVKNIPGIGKVTGKNLEALNISSVQALQRADMKLLQTKFDVETCMKLKNFSFGIDEGPVRGSVRPQSLGIEDAFTVTMVTSYEIIKSKYKALLERLLKLLADDGRVPLSMKVVVRKSDGIIKFGPRESRQIPLSASLFSRGVNDISENTKLSLYSLIVNAFHKMVNTDKPFCLSLVGLGFTKLVLQPSEKKSIANFFKKRSHDHSNESRQPEHHKHPKISIDPSGESSDFQISDKKEISEGCDGLTDDSCDSDFASPLNCDKKDAVDDNAKTLCLAKSSELTYSEREYEHIQSSSDRIDNFESSHSIPTNIDPDVFNSLPKDIQEEICMTYKVDTVNVKNETIITEDPKSTSQKCSSNLFPKISPHGGRSNSFFKNFIQPVSKKPSNDSPTNSQSDNLDQGKPTKIDPCSSNDDCFGPDKVPKSERSQVMGKLKVNDCDRELLDSIDYEVFSALPEELQKEILNEKRSQSSCSGLRTIVGLQPSTKKNVKSSPILKYFKKL